MDFCRHVTPGTVIAEPAAPERAAAEAAAPELVAPKRFVPSATTWTSLPRQAREDADAPPGSAADERPHVGEQWPTQESQEQHAAVVTVGGAGALGAFGGVPD